MSAKAEYQEMRFSTNRRSSVKSIKEMVNSALANSTGRRESIAKICLAIRDGENSGFGVFSELVESCVSSSHDDALDFGVDVLARCSLLTVNYVSRYLRQDVTNYNGLYGDRAYEPSDEYWHVLLRGLSLCDAPDAQKLQIIGMCVDATSRGIQEVVLESLANIESSEATAKIEKFLASDDSFIADLAREILADR